MLSSRISAADRGVVLSAALGEVQSRGARGRQAWREISPLLSRRDAVPLPFQQKRDFSEMPRISEEGKLCAGSGWVGRLPAAKGVKYARVPYC